MPVAPQPRFTDPEMLQYYLDVSGSSVPSAAVLAQVLASAEVIVERYTRRRFAPEPTLRTDYKRQLVSISGQQQTGTQSVAGTVALAYGASSTGQLVLPVTAAQLQGALTALSTIGLGNVTCAGGPLPVYPISVYLTGLGTSPSLLVADSSGLGTSGYALITDMGFDSNPPVTKRFTTRGHSQIRVPDLRLVDSAPDPRIPGSGGLTLYGRRLLPNQYFTGQNSYAPGGADEAFGTGDYSTPSTDIILGYGYGLGMTLAQQFAYVLPQMYLSNDLQITGRWGWLPTPPDVIDATYTIAARRYRERDVAFSDTMVTPEGAAFSFFKQLPASARAALDSYRVTNLALI